ncbi:hypothetical protein ACF0H5_023615 [Mactra antiquata]
MATSKHFPVQISPRSDSDDFLNETPYNTVTSFKSYPNTNSVLDTTPYTVFNQVDNGRNCTPYVSSPQSARHIDNTVVSAYGRTKPPLPSGKSNARLAYTNTSHRRQPNPNSNAKEVKEGERFGLKHLQTFSEKLKEENTLHRRQRHSRQNELTRNQHLTHESNYDKNNEDSYIDSDKLNSLTGTVRTHSARRKLPNVPERFGNQSEKVLSHNDECFGDKNEVEDILDILDSVLEGRETQQWDNSSETQTGTQVFVTESKVAQVKVLGKLSEPGWQKPSSNHNMEDSSYPKQEYSSETSAITKNIEGVKHVKQGEQKYQTSRANNMSEASSQSVERRNLNSVGNSQSESELLVKPSNLSKVDIWNNDTSDSDRDENTQCLLQMSNDSNVISNESNVMSKELIESIKKNMELTEKSELLNEEEVKLPANLFFTFDQNVIQELTDSVMEKKTNKSAKNEEDFNDTVDSAVDIQKNVNSQWEIVENTTTSPEKVEFEGKSFNEKSKNSSVNKGNSAKIDKIENKENDRKIENDGSENRFENGVVTKLENIDSKLPAPKTKKVERSPSYRKKVMARAKSRYKKSSMLKDCSCMKNEKGEIIVCNFCETYESKKRSKSSLGLESLSISGEIITPKDVNSQNEVSSPRRALTPGLPPLPTSASPRPLKKVQVSSRVDLLMSSDLFKKHLHKHSDLLQRHTMLSRTGLRKSVSSLDISDGFVLESDSQCETESVTSEINNDLDTSASESADSRSHDFSSPLSRSSRRHSLTGDSDSCIPIENVNKNKKKHFRTLPKSIGRTRPEIPSFTQPNFPLSNQRSNIPSFEEFKLLKEKLRATEDDTSEKCTQTMVQTNSKNVSIIRGDRNENISENRLNLDDIPLQLQVIKESDSKENLLGCEVASESNNDLSKACDVTDSSQDIVEVRVDHSNDESSSKTDISADFYTVTEHDKSECKKLTRQCSEPAVTNAKQGAKPKVKSRTLSNLELESESLSDHASGVVRTRGRKHAGAKRPRSLISKKSSLADLIKENQEGLSDDTESVSEKSTSIKDRPKLKVGHSVNRSKSDSRYEIDKENKPNRDKLRPTSFNEKGKNSVTFDLDDRSQCSPFDIGESETSTSVAGSLSDSLRSEVNPEDNILLPNDHDDTDKLLHDSDDVNSEEIEHLMNLKDEIVSQVSRSTSDACEITQEAARKKRERKERPYKSDPFSGTEIIPASKRWALREEKAKLRQRMDFANSSKEEILTFLDKVSSTDLINCDSFPSLEELNEDDEPIQITDDGVSGASRKIRKHLSNVSSLSTDSGVIGQDGSHDSQQSSPTNTLTHSHSERTVLPWKPTVKERSLSASCTDLSKAEVIECHECGPDNVIDVIQRSVCQQCLNRRTERKKTIQEIYDTEMNYGRDLNILKEEFYKPIMKAGLLNRDQLDAIFLNLDELIHVNKHFISKLKSAIDSANNNSDQEMENVMIGCLFLESSTMFLTFENYCVNQAEGPVLLHQLEREKELLRIFLQVSQSDNQQLRRMHLKSFLMVPVQRIMKYPLLLDRLYKTTPRRHLDKNSLKEAKEKIEDILGHINAKSRTTSLRPRKLSQRSQQQHCSVTEKIEVSRVALEMLQWNRKDVCDVITSQLQVTQPIDHTWAVKKCKNYKFTTVYGVLLTLMQQLGDKNMDDDNNVKNSLNNNINNNNNHNENNSPRVKSAAVVFIKEKNGRFQVMREPFMLEKCVVSQDPDYMDVFEILEWSKEAFLIKAETPHETKLWVQNLRQQMNCLGFWRKRRNALPNILLNHLS